jgi:nickel/cobalt transporter (NiCoT) family protein
MNIKTTTPQTNNVRTRLIVVYSFLLLLNVGGWVCAAVAFHATPVLLGVALLVYGLGLRHAVDADHIAAIDNVTRKLMQAGQRPVAVGFFFAAGHSALIILATALFVGTATLFERLRAFSSIGGLLSTAVSTAFLYAIAAMNLLIFVSLYKTFRKVRNGGIYVDEDLDVLLGGRGFLARIFRPVFRLVTKSWHMLPLGMLFGLGFDTATEIAMFGVSAGQASRGLSTAAIMILPVLFAAGMSLIDTTDGVMMLGAYDWAFVQPLRKLYYNMTITLVSAVVAALVAGVEAAGLVGGRFGFTGYIWEQVGALNSHFNTLGFAIIGLFALAWALSWLIYRVKRLDRYEVNIEASEKPSIVNQ